MADQHYAEHVERDFYPPLRAFATSGPLVSLLLEGDEAIDVVRAINGATDGRKAAPGTIRGDLSLSNRENLVHASDSPESADARDRALVPAALTHPSVPPGTAPFSTGAGAARFRRLVRGHPVRTPEPEMRIDPIAVGRASRRWDEQHLDLHRGGRAGRPRADRLHPGGQDRRRLVFAGRGGCAPSRRPR